MKHHPDPRELSGHVREAPLGSAEIKAGERTILNPGTVQVVWAHYAGHKIFTKENVYVGEVSNIQNWIPLLPGDYVIEIDNQKIPFTLKEGQDLKFEREK